MLSTEVRSTSDLLDDLAVVSRELGADPGLVLHGGGNSSVKLIGPEGATLWMKPSGRNMRALSGSDFVPLDFDAVVSLINDEHLTDESLMSQLRKLIRGVVTADPSVETLVHAVLPHDAVIHSHADILLALSDTPMSNEGLEEMLGDHVAVMGYVSSGVHLARACQDLWKSRSASDRPIDAILVRKHGLFAFASSAQSALAVHRRVISSAEKVLRQGEVHWRGASQLELIDETAAYMPELRKLLSEQAERPLVVRSFSGLGCAYESSSIEALKSLTAGPITPDHVNWIGFRPTLGRSALEHIQTHSSFVEAEYGLDEVPDIALFPRVLYDPLVGFLATVGDDATQAKKTSEVLASNIHVASTANKIGGYVPAGIAPTRELAEWSAQQAKIGRRRTGPLTGHSALVTGAASGIGKACVESLLDAGASVVGWDLADSVKEVSSSANYTGVVLNVTNEVEMNQEVQRVIALHGGLDIIVVAAGIFPQAQPIGELNIETWRTVLDVNVTSVAMLLSVTERVLAMSPCDPQVIVIGSKNVAAPGPGAAAYSASKAALTQLARVAAMEWGPLGIRVNVIHPNAVFDTALWTPELLMARAESYGMTVEQYKSNNLLGREVTSRGVGDLVVSLCGPAYRTTTGAQIPIDGGNERTL